MTATRSIDLEAVWTMYGATGDSITPATQINSTYLAADRSPQSFSHTSAGWFANPGASSWGPKIKANLFGDGIGMGATSFQLGDEVPQLRHSK
jgi:hypothetical protein